MSSLSRELNKRELSELQHNLYSCILTHQYLISAQRFHRHMFSAMKTATMLVVLAIAATIVVGHQITELPSLLYVNKFRTWTNNVEPTFRPNNGTFISRLPVIRIPVSAPQIAMHSVATVSSTGRIVCFGGMIPRLDNASLDAPFERGNNVTLVYDPPTNSWYMEPLWSRVAPPPRVDHVSWSIGDLVFIHGGENETVMSDVWRYTNRSWKMLNFRGMPSRTGHSIEVDPIDDTTTAYLFGGRNELGVRTNSLFAVSLNGSVRQLFTVGEVPSVREYHASAVMVSPTAGPIVFIHGGYDGYSGLKDLFAYYPRRNKWVRINSGFSEASVSFSGDLVASVTLPNVYRHSCKAQYPTMFCIGGRSTGDPVSFEFDLVLNRYIELFFSNPNHVFPLAGHKTVTYKNTSNVTEILVIGGYTGSPTQFASPVVVKTTLQMDACPAPYINPDWLGTCRVCPRGSGYNASLNLHRCFPCRRGTFSDFSICQPCPAGTYNPHNSSANVSSCIACPKGYFTAQQGSWTFSQCITCQIGTYANGGACQKCPSGTYGIKKGALTVDEGCAPCSYGSYSDLGAVACTPCPPGTSGPTFIRSLDAYKLEFIGMDQSTMGSPQCGGFSTPLATIYNDKFFWLNFQVRDFGESGMSLLNAYNPLDVTFFFPNLKLYAYFQGNSGVMYYNCPQGQSMYPGCSSVTENQTTPLIAYTTSCNTFGTYQLVLRFSNPSPQTKVFIKADGLVGLNFSFSVVNNFQTVAFSKWPSVFVIGQTQPMTVYAWLLGAVEPSSSFSAKILVTCLYVDRSIGASLSPTYKVNGNFAANLQTVSIVNGSAPVFIDFVQHATGCVFKSQDQYGVITQPNTYPPFAIQRPAAMYARILTKNTSNWGTIHVEVRMVDVYGATITGDNTSKVLVKLWKDGHSIMQPTEMVQTLVNGMAVFRPVVHSLNPWSNYAYGRFQVVHISGLQTLMKDNITDRFSTHRVNGTMLRISNETVQFPSIVRVNSTIDFFLENVNRLTGEQDGSRDVVIQVQLIGCPARITATNHSASVVRIRLPSGHGPVSLYVQGYDGSGCRLNVFEVPTRAGHTAKGFTTPMFSVVSPRKAVRDGCALSQCGTCVAPYAGQIITYNISLQTLAGRVAAVNDLVIRFVPLGNKSAVVPADGVLERRVVDGNVTVPVLYLPSTNATGARFDVGRWTGVEKTWFTYITSPTFIRHVNTSGVHTKFIVNTAIQPAVTCLRVPRTIATKVVVTSPIPRWSAQNDMWKIKLLAVNNYSVIDTNSFSTITARIQHCEQGVYKDLTVVAVDPVSGVTLATLYSPSTASNAAPFVSISNLNHGQGEIWIKPLFTTDSDWNGGVKKCELTISISGLVSALLAAPEFRKVYPSCPVCPPGYWSSGGDGRNTTVTYHHPGGCMPCSVGTFSAFSGAATIAACSACQTGFGYSLGQYVDNTIKEGAIQCSTFCAYGTGGQAGGGVCGSYSILGRSDVTTNRWAQYGRTGRVCADSGCLGAVACSAGQFYLSCPAQTTQAACEHADNVGACKWNSVKSVCSGAVFNCLPCPPGTVNVQARTLSPKAAACTPCDAGGWSSDRGHTVAYTQYSLAQYRCTGNWYPTYNARCYGASTGQCWNGTYSVTTGATDNSTCIPCPKGYYCPQVSIYTMANVCPPGCSYASMTACATGCYRCPYSSLMTVGNFKPIPCPPGTFNNRTGRWRPSDCLLCPAGTTCALGSIVPTWVDKYNTQSTNGKTAPYGVTYTGNPQDITLCGSEAADDAQGYVKDGRVSNFKTFWVLNSGTNYFVPTAYKDYWGGKNWMYSSIDRDGDATSGSIQMNATGAIANQKIIVNHELPLEMVARAWVQFNLYTYPKNVTQIGNVKVVKPFCGISMGVHYTDGNEMDSYNYTWYSKMFSVRPPTVINSTKIIVGWYLIEIPFSPKRAVRWIDFNLVVQGYYYGTARFDDMSVKPSHRRVCNCSTGYYYNQSVKTSRVCLRCPPGFACSGGTMTRCVNSWSAVSYAGCQYCYDGWECDADGRGRQIPCALYNRKDNATETCSPCPLGYACRDGNMLQCDSGFYGDGGLDCVPCKPGYYSLPGAPRWQCERCPPGTTSVHARWYCTACPENHYSVNGTQCARCPNGYFAPSGGATACRSCTNTFLDHYNITVSRNKLDFAVRVVPPYCEPFFKFQVDTVSSLVHGSLGLATPSQVTPSVLYKAGPILGTHVFRAFVTAGYLLPTQYADVQVRIVNTAPIAVADSITFPHPRKLTVHALNTLMSNDYDPDLDDIFFATAVQLSNLTQYWAYNLTISADRKTLYVTLPANFTGPAHVTYSVMDQFHASISDCVPPACLFSSQVTATFYCVDAYPVAVPDAFSFPVGRVYPINVLYNDYDIDGDDIAIVNITAGSLSGISPAIQKSCSACSGACVGTYNGTCTCSYDAQRLKCYPSNGIEYFLDYTANTGVCGYDTFGYRIQTNDGNAWTTVTVRNTRCYCMTKTVGFNMIFLLDGTQTTSDFGFQLDFADAVARRSAAGTNFRYGIIEVGANRVLQNLSNTYFNLDQMSRAADGNRALYTLGKGLQMAASMIKTFVTDSSVNYIVMVTSKESFDSANIYGSLGIASRFMTVTINPNSKVTSTFLNYFANPYYQGTATSFVDLTQHTAEIAQEMMDIMCSN